MTTITNQLGRMVNTPRCYDYELDMIIAAGVRRAYRVKAPTIFHAYSVGAAAAAAVPGTIFNRVTPCRQ